MLACFAPLLAAPLPYISMHVFDRLQFRLVIMHGGSGINHGHLPVLQASWTELNQLQLGIMLYKDRQLLSDVIAVC